MSRFRGKNCGVCEFWWDVENITEEGGVPLGSCRRHAPQLVVGLAEHLFRSHAAMPGQEDCPIGELEFEHAADAIWPVTRYWDWCGEFQRREDDDGVNHV